jgi:hypothetical protein
MRQQSESLLLHPGGVSPSNVYVNFLLHEASLMFDHQAKIVRIRDIHFFHYFFSSFRLLWMYNDCQLSDSLMNIRLTRLADGESCQRTRDRQRDILFVISWPIFFFVDFTFARLFNLKHPKVIASGDCCARPACLFAATATAFLSHLLSTNKTQIEVNRTWKMNFQFSFTHLIILVIHSNIPCDELVCWINGE